MITGTCRQNFKELPCFGGKFSNIHPALESGFLPGTFFGGGGGGGKVYCYSNLFCYANFSIVLKPIFFGRGVNSQAIA